MHRLPLGYMLMFFYYEISFLFVYCFHAEIISQSSMRKRVTGLEIYHNDFQKSPIFNKSM